MYEGRPWVYRVTRRNTVKVKEDVRLFNTRTDSRVGVERNLLKFPSLD